MIRLLIRLTLVSALSMLVTGCTTIQRIGLSFVYDEADLPDADVRRDLAYRDTGNPKHRLNLFLPLADSVRAAPWPFVVFVHGGGWTEGDRDYTFGGADIYNNIGRFFAQHGIGAATVSYRLMPEATWREQVDDVEAAIRWVQTHASDYGGDARNVFVMGHSAGAYLAAFAALDTTRALDICGVMPVSGAALDLTDRETYDLEDNFDYYAHRFSPDKQALETPPAEPFAWQRDASPILQIHPDAPPFLILYAGGETEALQRQSRLFDAALQSAGVESEIVVVPGQSHSRIVPTLSRDDRTAGPALLRFVRRQACR